ncbi:GGDEF domain-containing protein [Motilimonas pumila]|uniref:diguanylate cyclase n=1 Tax=Motilimonas pumila TaxID=2303987 RepID=A0A418YA56_9GAMM|nr:GGDEF domain-containing protein [Motilimonas pumila]RJG39186.1 GGDEF domain-containing protein [Motilimonas pumila]
MVNTKPSMALLFACSLIFIHIMFFDFVQDIDVISFLSESTIVASLIAIIFLLKPIENKPGVYNLVFAGFFLLFISLLTDALDEVFQQPAAVSLLFEDIIQVSGFLILCYGINQWRLHSEKMPSELHAVAPKDPLTQLPDRHYFINHAQLEFDRMQRSQLTFSILIVEVDQYKQFSIERGHTFTNLMLNKYAQVAQQHIRKSDVISYWSDNEFIVCLAECNDEQHGAVAEKLRQAALHLALPGHTEYGQPGITVSIGCTASKEQDRSLDDLIGRAYQQLHQAIAVGRNSVMA